MYTAFLYLHSILRYIVVILMIWAIVNSFIGWFYRKPYTNLDDKVSLFFMISCHVQLLVGLTLYGISSLSHHGMIYAFLHDMSVTMHDTYSRFWTLEHPVGMIIGIALITIGRIKSKKKTDDNDKHRISFIFFFIGFLIIFFFIPWPWKHIIGRGWFN